MIGVVTDVSSLESVESLRDATLGAFGAVHLVCNNAAIPSGSDGALWEHHVNDWRWAVDVNVYRRDPRHQHVRAGAARAGRRAM